MIGRHPQPHETPRRRQPLDQVDLDGRVLAREERTGRVEPGRTRADDGDTKGTRFAHRARIITVAWTQPGNRSRRTAGTASSSSSGFWTAAELARLRDRFARAFAHEWETGLRPDEVNYEPGVTPPDKTRQLCNVWKADRTLAATVLSARNAAFGARLAGAPGLRLIQDNAIWKPPSGKALLCHQDAAYVEWLEPPNMTTCWMALDDTSADAGTIYYVRGSRHWPRAAVGGQFHAPDDWLGHVREVAPDARARSRPDRGAGRRRGLSRRLDVPRLTAQRASRPGAPRDRQPHGLDRDPLG